MNEALQRATERDIRVVADSLGLAVVKNGRAAHCVHSRGPGRGTPSISFRKGIDGRERFRCHSCGEGGDVLDLVQFVMGCDAKAAITHLTGVLPERKAEWVAVDDEPARVPYLVRVKACEAFYSGCAELDVVATRWLQDKRGIDPLIAADFGLRVVTQDRNAGPQSGARAFSALMGAVGPAVAQALSLAKQSGKSDTLYMPLWGHWLVIPYRDDTGQIGHLQFRRLHRSDDSASKGGKYRHIGGEVPYPWNYAACYGEGHPGKTFTVEGVLDAMVLESKGIPAMGIPGTRWLNADRAARLAKRAESTLVVGFDADAPRERPDGTTYAPGPDAQKEAARLLAEAGAKVEAVDWPDDFVFDPERDDWCDWFQLHETAMPAVAPFRRPSSGNSFRLSEAFLEAADHQQDIAMGRVAESFLTTGMGKKIDSVLGTEPGEMTIVGARPHGGKSHLMLSQAIAQSNEHQIDVGVLSLEMSRQGLGLRALLADMGASRDDWYGFSADKRAWMTEEAKGRLDRYEGLRVVHPEKRDAETVVKECRTLIDQGCGVVWIDHVQHIASAGDSWKTIDEVSKTLFGMFKAAGVPWYLLVQLSRGIEKRANRAPMMSDIKGCGSLEEVTDRIVTIGCPNEWEEDRSPREFQLTKLKDRNGGTGSGGAVLWLPEPFGWFVQYEGGMSL